MLQSQIVNITKMSFNAIRKIKFLQYFIFYAFHNLFTIKRSLPIKLYISVFKVSMHSFHVTIRESRIFSIYLAAIIYFNSHFVFCLRSNL